MEQSKIDDFFDKYFFPVTIWLLWAMQIVCGGITVFHVWRWNKFEMFSFLILTVLIYVTGEMLHGYRWKRYIDAETGNRRIRRLKNKLFNRAKKQVYRGMNTTKK